MVKDKIVDKFSDEQFKEIVEKSQSIRHLMKLLGYKTHSKKALRPILERCDKLDLVITKRVYTKHSDEEILNAAKNEKSIIAVMRKLGLSTNGYAHERIRERLKKLGFNFEYKPWNKGLKHQKRNVLEYLVIDGPLIGSSKLKQRLLRQGLKCNKCEICNLTKWLDKHIKLQLDHINGNKKDNRLENLRILCPNCHAQTITYSRPKAFLQKIN